MTITRTMHKCPIPFWTFSRIAQHIAVEYPYRSLDFARSYSENQMRAKSWLVERLSLSPAAGKKNKSIYVLGAWYGTLIVPLLRHYFKDIKEIVLVDYDRDTLNIATMMFSGIKTKCMDVSFDLEELEADIIINTSCEHMWHMKDISFKGLCAFQSNDFLQETAHVNCVQSLEEFKEQTGITNVHYQGEIPFDDYHDNKRFMIIGEQ